MSQKIPFNRTSLVGDELENVAAAVRSGHLSGDGGFGKACSRLLEEDLGAERVMLTPSCTAALEMSALLLEIEPGDEVIVPSFAFVTTASAFALFGAKPVFVDIRPETLNLDVDCVEHAITGKTKAVVALHYGGVGCDMDRLGELSKGHQLVVVEDNAHGLFGTYRGRHLGTFGAVSTNSFHETKNFSCGEGGALVVNRPEWVERAEILREKGTNRSRFFRGQVDKYTWVDLGSSYLPSELQSAFLLAQLEKRTLIQRRRHEIWERYHSELGTWSQRCGISLPQVPEECGFTAHVFYLVMRDLEERSRFITHLADRGVMAVFHYQPLHLSQQGRVFGGFQGQCPVTERMADCLVRLPLFYDLSNEELEQVIEACISFSSTSGGR